MIVNIVTLTETPQSGAKTFKRRMEDGRKYRYNKNNKGRRNTYDSKYSYTYRNHPKVQQKP